ncbi:MAG: hypothetical protein H0W23_08905 [Chloroflexia bacterium]|nr:hypothetical protein [Chloroflexia bacterium]
MPVTPPAAKEAARYPLLDSTNRPIVSSAFVQGTSSALVTSSTATRVSRGGGPRQLTLDDEQVDRGDAEDYRQHYELGDQGLGHKRSSVARSGCRRAASPRKTR